MLCAIIARFAFSFLLIFDPNKNFCQESDRIFHYIALELCDMTLDAYIQENIGKLKRADKLDLMMQTIEGIAHLHRNHISLDTFMKHAFLLEFYGIYSINLILFCL